MEKKKTLEQKKNFQNSLSMKKSLRNESKIKIFLIQGKLKESIANRIFRRYTKGIYWLMGNNTRRKHETSKIIEEQQK